jgi:deazaflavin-dependent oxidoreductase (nitroreductase family)
MATRVFGWLKRAVEKVASTRAGGWYFLNVANPIDKRLVPLTRGWVSLAPGQPVLVLGTVGAKSGQVRRTPLLYVTDGDDIVLVASKAGAPKHPAWYHNLRANPEVTLYVRRRTGRYRARVAEGEEYDRLWARATETYGGYDAYKQRAGARKIPLVALSPIR